MASANSDLLDVKIEIRSDKIASFVLLKGLLGFKYSPKPSPFDVFLSTLWCRKLAESN